MRAGPPLFILILCGALAGAPAAGLAQARQERDAAPTEGLSEVGKGQHMARQGLKPGAYITPRHRQAVRAWLAKNFGPGQPCLPGLVRQGGGCARGADAVAWKMGTPVPEKARLEPLPAGLAGALPPAPPGNRYVLMSGDILLIAADSRIVVDAVPAPH